MGEFATKGFAGGVGIPALVLGSLGFLQSGGLGALGGAFGGWGNCGNRGWGWNGGGCGTGIGDQQAAYINSISSKDAEIAQLKSERYADQVGIGVYQKAIDLSNRNDDQIRQNLKEAFQELVVTRERLATSDANFKCLTAAVERLGLNVNNLNAEIVDIKVRDQKTADAIALEAERRECGDQRLFEFVNCNYVKAQKKISKDDICPEVMPRWNSWTAPTGEAPAIQPITGSISVNRK